MKYWEMIANGLRRKCWCWSAGWFRFVQEGRALWSADATKGGGVRIVVQAEYLGVSFLELEMQCGGVEKNGIDALCR